MQLSQTLLYLGAWSLLRLIKNKDVEKVSKLPDVVGDKGVLEEGWNALDAHSE